MDFLHHAKNHLQFEVGHFHLNPEKTFTSSVHGFEFCIFNRSILLLIIIQMISKEVSICYMEAASKLTSCVSFSERSFSLNNN